MMLPDFEKCVARLVETLVQASAPNVSDVSKHEKVAQFLINTHARMPDYLRLSFRVLTLIFDAWPLLTKGTTFHALNSSSRMSQLAKWKSSKIKVKNSLITFYESLTVFALYSDLYKQDFDIAVKRYDA